MERNNRVPLEIQIKIAQEKAVETGETRPLWQILLDDNSLLLSPPSSNSPACPKRSSEIADKPDNMGEALNRLKTLEEWIKAGLPVKQFYEYFGPPKGVEIND